jgi:hypothetical protein
MTAVQTQPASTLTLGDRFSFETHNILGPSSFVVPAFESGIIMADPPHGYPREWSDGGGAFARNYGSEVGRHVTGGMTHFLAAYALHEDPRYYPTSSNNVAARFGHALLFTVIDRRSADHRDLALSNFAGAAAAGFIGNLWEPRGFNDITHGGQRAALEMSTFASHNLIAEFSPQLERFARKIHFPSRWTDALLPKDRREP